MKLEDILISENDGKEFEFEFENRTYRYRVVEEGDGQIDLEESNTGVYIQTDFYLSHILGFDFKEVN